MTNDAGNAAPAQPSAPAPTPLGPGRTMAPATWGWLVALLGWTCIVAFFHLNGGADFQPVDAWVGQTAREMYENVQADGAQGLIVPQFSGETRLQKSPGPYWAVMLTAYLRGTPVDEVAVRIPNAIFAVLLVLVVFWLTLHIAGDRAAIFAGFATASSGVLLFWSHRGASDLGVSALMAASLACLWIGSECTRPGARRVLQWLAGYLLAGLAMLYKMPYPLVFVGLVAVLYVVLCGRWRIFASWWHLVGLILFCLPWAPWMFAVVADIAAGDPNLTWTDVFAKWKVEYVDRMTGTLPNVDEQKTWYFYFMYVGVALAFAFPYTLSVFQAVARGFRRAPGVFDLGRWFLLIWLLGHFAFLTAATGKETRYFLPAMPALFALLGLELAAFFRHDRTVSPARERAGLIAACVLAPAGVVGVGFLLKHWAKSTSASTLFTPMQLWFPATVTGAIFVVGVITAAVLYYRRRENTSFAALVATMFVSWLWFWPQFAPVLLSQEPFIRLAQDMRDRLTPEQQAALRQVSHQDPRFMWYGDVRYGRTIDQLELLAEQDGQRNLDYEVRRVGEEIIKLLRGDELALFVASAAEYRQLHLEAPALLAKQGERMPDTYIWLQAKTGRPDQRYVVFGNQPPPWPQEEWAQGEKPRAKLAKAREEAELTLQAHREQAEP